jgi:hypothetical protein
LSFLFFFVKLFDSNDIKLPTKNESNILSKPTIQPDLLAVNKNCIQEKIFKYNTKFTNYCELKEEIYRIADHVEKTFSHKLTTPVQLNRFGRGSITSKLWEYYNIFQFNEPQLNKIYDEIISVFKMKYNPTQPYFISAWVNIHKKNAKKCRRYICNKFRT